MSVTIRQFYECSREWLNTPYVDKGRTKGVAGDCIFFIKVGQELGLTDFDTNEYTRRPKPQFLLAMADKLLLRQHRTRADLRFGDIVVMAFRQLPMHFAIVGDAERPFSLLHSAEEIGHCAEHRLDDDSWRKIRRVYRIPGVIYE